ncbi:MAG: hypothetical protein EP299_04030 [Acidobacteria bacterium]|nr:MAG: hypothetical protein EP299_04030 [Acidobacteriota bacterium]
MKFLSSRRRILVLVAVVLVGGVGESVAQEEPRFRLELEAGAVWQTSNGPDTQQRARHTVLARGAGG